MKGGSSWDADALAFIASASITDATQKSAINTLVTDSKTAGIWTKMKAIYPFVGGTASQHRFNLKDPRALTAAFYLDFIGGGTHSSNGFLTDNSTAYAKTYFSPSSNQSLTSGHFSLYSRTFLNGALYASSGIRDSDSKGSTIYIRRSDNLSAGVMWDENTGGVANAGTIFDGRGLFTLSRTASNSLKYYRNNTLLVSNTSAQTATTLSTNNYFIGSQNQGGTPGALTYENKEFAFASIGDGLSDAESSSLYTIVQAYQTTLGRAV